MLVVPVKVKLPSVKLVDSENVPSRSSRNPRLLPQSPVATDGDKATLIPVRPGKCAGQRIAASDEHVVEHKQPCRHVAVLPDCRPGGDVHTGEFRDVAASRPARCRNAKTGKSSLVARRIRGMEQLAH